MQKHISQWPSRAPQWILKKLNHVFIVPLLISFKVPLLLQNENIYVIFTVPEKCLYYSMSEPNFILNGFLCGSPYIGSPYISSYPWFGHIFMRTPQELPVSDMSYYRKIQTLKGTQTSLVNKDSKIIIIC